MSERPDGHGRHTRNPRGKGDRLREELIAAANRLLEEGATHESLSLRAVARAVGIAATSVYLHFPDKMSLLLAVYQQHFEHLTAEIANAVDQHDEPAARLRAAVAAYYQFAADHPDVYQIMFTVPSISPPRPVPEDQRPGAGVLLTVQTVLNECIAAGLLAPGIDPYPAALCLWAALHGLITLRAARPSVPWPPVDTLLDTLIDTYLGVRRSTAT